MNCDEYLRALGLAQSLVGVPGPQMIGCGPPQPVAPAWTSSNQQLLIFLDILQNSPVHWI